MKINNELYFSVDVEADGPIPGPYSMLSVGCVACHPDLGLVDYFTRNLDRIPNAGQDPDTMEWWDKHPEAYDKLFIGRVSPMRAMLDFHKWIDQVCGRTVWREPQRVDDVSEPKVHKSKPVMVAYPAGFDFTFTHWYFMNYTGNDPFGFQCVDMKTYAMALMKSPFEETVKANMPPRWFEDIPESSLRHVALNDAIEQAHLWLAMLSIRA